MTNHFSPSQNILIDSFDVTQYLITPNVQEVFDTLTANFASGLKSVNLIGAYGTGKSSFLNAIDYHLTQTPIFLDNGKWKSKSSVRIIKLVGQHESIINSFAELFNAKSNKPLDVVSSIEEGIIAANKNKQTFLLFIDEFGKFLEYASVNHAEKELYFLQQVSEVFNNPKYDAAFITTLHQDFAAYSTKLNALQRNEWTKVKGRFAELTFNEPVEQLLLLASKKINANPTKENQEKIAMLLKVIQNAKAFPLKDYFDAKVANKIYPLDLLSTGILALALQQYGQNERSLFTFLNSESFYGLQELNYQKVNFYSVANVYDYLNYNLYSFLNSKANIHYGKWAEIKNSLERIEGEIPADQHQLYNTIIKSIGMLNIFGHKAAKLDREFLVGYITQTLNLDGVGGAIDDLLKRNLIDYNRFSQRYFYSETTEVDIDDAISEASLELSRTNNTVDFLNSYFSLGPVSAKRSYYQKGTPRIFQYKITEQPYLALRAEGQIDGFINLLFNDQVKKEDLLQLSIDKPTLFAHFQQVDDIKHAIEEIEKAEIAKKKYYKDKIIQRELGSIIDLQKSLLNHYLHEGFFDPDSVTWYYNGNTTNFKNSKELNAYLSKIADELYPRTPIFISELANKSKLSVQISVARKLLLDALLQHSDKENLGIEGFPPQKSIYLTLLKQTGIHKETTEGWSIGEIDSENDIYGFYPLFETGKDFINSTRSSKRSVIELYDHLQLAPFKLKKGFLDFWIPIYLIIKSDEFALYGLHGFVPEITDEVLDLLIKNPSHYSIKAFDSDGIKIALFNQYRNLLALEGAETTSKDAFIKTIIPFIKFYRELKPVVKNTKRLTKKALLIRKALTNATDPEKLFFEDFPSALGYDTIQISKKPDLLQKFGEDLRESIRELRGAYDAILDRFEGIIMGIWKRDLEFPAYKELIYARYSNSLKQYLLLPYQKTFYDRLCSPLENRAAWLSSVAQATIGQTLDNISDEQLERLQERFLQLIHELDNLNDIALQKVDLKQEKVFRFEISSPGQNPTEKIIRMPLEDSLEHTKILQGLMSAMKNENHFTKIAILAQLLKEELDTHGN